MATNPRNSEPLVFPIGHYLGPFYPGENAPLKHHIVRVGWGTPKLPDDDHMSLWALSHGMSSRIGTTPWTRRAVEDAAHEGGMNDPAPIFDTLLKLGVVVELGDPMEFAKRYRMQALMSGWATRPTIRCTAASGCRASRPPSSCRWRRTSCGSGATSETASGSPANYWRTSPGRRCLRSPRKPTPHTSSTVRSAGCAR